MCFNGKSLDRFGLQQLKEMVQLSRNSSFMEKLVPFLHITTELTSSIRKEKTHSNVSISYEQNNNTNITIENIVENYM